MIHQDPFDRLLIAQTLVEKFTLITTNSIILQYNIPVIKA